MRFRHNDMNHLEECLAMAGPGRRLVIVDAVYSMEGDVANLPSISALRRRDRGFIYSAAMPAPSAAAALEALRLIQDQLDRVATLHRNTAYFRNRLQAAGFEFLNSPTPVFPIMCGDDDVARALPAVPAEAAGSRERRSAELLRALRAPAR